MIEVKRDDRQGFSVKLTLNTYSNYLTEAAAIELRDKLTAVLPSDKPDPRDEIIEARERIGQIAWRLDREEAIVAEMRKDLQKAKDELSALEATK